MMIAPVEAMSWRTLLRTRTRPRHDETDIAFSRLDLSVREGLATFLTTSLLALRSLESRLTQAASLPALPRRVPLLTADLAALGFAVPEHTPEDLEKLDPLGLAYVVGGSALGTRILKQRWETTRDPIVARAGRYLSDVRIGLYWKELRDDHLALTADPARIEGVVAAADAAFDLYRAALRRTTLQVTHGHG